MAPYRFQLLWGWYSCHITNVGVSLVSFSSASSQSNVVVLHLQSLPIVYILGSRAYCPPFLCHGSWKGLGQKGSDQVSALDWGWFCRYMLHCFKSISHKALSCAGGPVYCSIIVVNCWQGKWTFSIGCLVSIYISSLGFCQSSLSGLGAQFCEVLLDLFWDFAMDGALV